MKKIIISFSIIAAAAAIVFGVTTAFFSDTEISTGNTFTAGAIDLQIDSVQHYNGNTCVATTAGQNPYIWSGDAPYPVKGTACTGSWALKDLTGERFFDFDDIKPGDSGENTISLHVVSNEAYACAEISGVSEADNSLTEPEVAIGDTIENGGELAKNIDFFVWRESDGDNVYETGETPLTQGPVNGSAITDGIFTIADSQSGAPIAGGQTAYLGVAWCAGTMTVDGYTISCDGSTMNNEAQTDSMSADVKFTVVQARNNPDFHCNAL